MEKAKKKKNNKEKNPQSYENKQRRDTKNKLFL